jgi:orotidine-5'-phosphate decarboxylase
MLMTGFIEKLRVSQAAAQTPLCIGLDPDLDKLPAPIERSVQGLQHFCTAIIDATADIVSVYKPNLAFFLAHGAEGVNALASVIAHIPKNVPVIIDAKFGDIGNTASYYAKFAFEQLGADAVTVSPYVGTEAIQPFLAFPGKLVFVLCRTSNTAGNEFQNWPTAESPLYHQVTKQALALSQSHPDQVGLVVGATQPSEMAQVREWAPTLPFLIPGVGAQGGDLESSVRLGKTSTGLDPVINISRAALYANHGDDFAQAARNHILSLQAQLHVNV